MKKNKFDGISVMLIIAIIITLVLLVQTLTAQQSENSFCNKECTSVAYQSACLQCEDVRIEINPVVPYTISNDSLIVEYSSNEELQITIYFTFGSCVGSNCDLDVDQLQYTVYYTPPCCDQYICSSEYDCTIEETFIDTTLSISNTGCNVYNVVEHIAIPPRVDTLVVVDTITLTQIDTLVVVETEIQIQTDTITLLEFVPITEWDTIYVYDTTVLEIVYKEKLVDDIVYVPNAVNPNNSNYENSYFIIFSKKDYLIKDLEIFDRWGNLVHDLHMTSTNVQAWDCTYRNQSVSGVYNYKFEVDTGSGWVFYKGSFIIIK